jgi:DNA-binding transcriptional regulator YdaS (Cro superfamily)
MAGEHIAPSVELPAARAIRLLGGPVRAAERLGVERYQTVQSWLRNRVPAEYCPLIERATREKGDPVTCEELRPDVAWDVLRDNAGDAAASKVG